MYSWYVLWVLTLIYVCNIADRNVLAILAHDVQRDLHLTDFQLGLLVGPAIAFFYAILGVPMAYFADRTHRVRFLAVCLLLWSALTAAGAFAANILQLGASRIGVSAMEAGGSPCSSSIVADYFEPGRRAMAMGIYSAASVTGIFVGFAFAGAINDAIGWRGAFILAGAPGVVLALLLFATVREPVRGQRDRVTGGARQDPGSFWRTLQRLWRLQFYRRVVLASGTANFCIHGISNWGPAFILRKFGATTAEVGFLLGLGMAVFGASAMLVGGAFIGRSARSGIRRPVQCAGLLQFAAIPFWLGALFVPDYHWSLLLHALAYGAMSFFAPVYWVAAVSYTPPETRATAAAVALMFVAIVGASLLAPVVGGLSDLLASRLHAESLQYALAAIAILMVVPGTLFLHAARAAPAGGDV